MPNATSDTIEAPRGGIAYKTLKQTNPEYDGELLETLEDLYVGGFKIIKNARRYLVRLVNEHPDRYAERCRTASYQPFFGQIVDQFTSDLFGQPLSIKPAADASDPKTPGELPDKDYYSAFEKDVDREGKSFVDLMIDVTRTALKKRVAIVAVDAPKDDIGGPPVSRADEESRGLTRLYAYEVPVEQLIDWKCKRGGSEFVWAIINTIEQDRDTPTSDRSTIRESFTVWTMPDGNGAGAHWQRYAVTYKSDKRPDPDEIVPLEDEGDSGFRRIPLLRFDLPHGLWVGNKIGPQAREHWQRRSALVGAEARSMMAIPFVKKGPEAPSAGGAIPAEVTQNPHRGDRPVERFQSDGWVELGSEDELGYAEPTGRCYELVDKQLTELRDAMFAVNHQMAASIRPTAGAVHRSGLSKQKDEDSTGRVLRALGHEVRQFAVRVWSTLSEARGEDVHWAPHGLDGYDSEDREQVIEEALALDEIPIDSPTFRKIHKRMTAEKLVKGIDPDTLTTMVNEIEESVDEEQEIRRLKKDAEVDRIKNPIPAIAVPAAPVPVVPKATVPQPPRPQPAAP